MNNRFVLFYVVAIHLLLITVLLKSDFIQRVEYKLGIASPLPEITEHFHQMLSFHSRMDGNVPRQSVIFIGDSLIQGLAVTAVANPSVNYGIGNDTTVGVLRRLPTYRSIENAKVVVIAIGANDMKYRSNQEISHNLQTIAEKMPDAVPLIFSGILPLDEDANVELRGRNARIRALNSNTKAWTAVSANRFFVDAGPKLIDEKGNLADEFHVGDGIHLNSRGNAIWIQQLRSAINNVR